MKMFNNYRLIYTYLTKEYLKIFILSLCSLVLVYNIILFFQKIDLFIKKQAALYLIFEYLIFKSPEVIFQWTLPYAVLLATLLTLGNLSNHNEITAMKAGGISLYRIVSPFILIALIISFFSFLGNEYLLPYTNEKTHYILDVKVRKEKPFGFFKNYKIWYRSENLIFNVQMIEIEKNVLKGLTIYEIDQKFKLTKRIDASEAKWLNNRWQLLNGVIRNFGVDGSINVKLFEIIEINIPVTWENFKNIERRSREMSYTELRNYIQKIQYAGYDATRYLVELYSKYSFPLLNIIMVLIGIPFSFKTARSKGVTLNIGISIIIGFIYGIIYYIFVSFGKSGVLPPLLASWTPTIIFTLAGILALMSVRH